MTEPPRRDWDKELAAVDKAMERQGPPSAPAQLPAAAGSGATRAVARRSVALAWLWAGLALLFGAALALWPYERGCGMQLAFYLGAAAVAFIVAMWGAVASWRFRRGVAHLLSLLVIVWLAIAVAAEVLPRIGYAKTERAWLCPPLAPPTPPRNP